MQGIIFLLPVLSIKSSTLNLKVNQEVNSTVLTLLKHVSCLFCTLDIQLENLHIRFQFTRDECWKAHHSLCMSPGEGQSDHNESFCSISHFFVPQTQELYSQRDK